MGILTSIVIALLTAIWSEIRTARKEVNAHGSRLSIVETVVRLLPCKIGNCSLEESNERLDES
jgi:hypothetical protein